MASSSPSLPSLLARALGSRSPRFWLAAAGVAAGILLALVLGAAYRTASESAVAYLSQSGADLWVAAAGTDNFIRSSALLPEEFADSIRAIPGVAAADPMLRAFVVASTDARPGREARRLSLYGVAYRTASGLGGPPVLAAGRLPTGRKEVALDRAAALRLGVGLGDTLWLGGRRRVVAGLTSGTNLLLTQFIFADLDSANVPQGLKGKASFLIVRLAPGGDQQRVIGTVRERFPELAIFDRATFVANSRREAGAGFIPMLLMISIIGALATALLVALLIHGVLEERRTDMAVLLALGANLPSLGRALLRHTAGLLLAGALLGLATTLAIAALLDRYYPIVTLRLELLPVLGVLALFVITGLATAVVPALRLRNLDPMDAFRP